MTTIITEKKEITTPKPELHEPKKSLKYQREKDKELVKGIFRFHEIPGGCLSFVYGPMYKGDQTERFDLVDGQIYTLPLGVAKHLNKNLWYPVYEHIKGEPNTQGAFNQMTGTSMRIGQKVRRCSFQSLEFVDVDDLTPNGSPLVSVDLM